MQIKNIALLFFALGALPLGFGGCASEPVKPAVSVYFAPSMERAIEILNETADGRELSDYLHAHPIPITYAQLPAPWPQYDPQVKQLFLPKELKDNDYLVALALMRGIETYRLCETLRLDEIMLEVDQIAAIREMQMIIELGLENKEGENSASGRQMLDEACSYMIGGPRALAEKVKSDALSPLRPDYGRYYRPASVKLSWLRQIKTALDANTLPQVMQKFDRDRVRRGEITMADADKNAMEFRSMDLRQMYRKYDDLYLHGTKSLDNLEKEYEKRLAAAADWHDKYRKAVARQLARTTYCNTFIKAQ